jgi:chromosome segregation ATPase
MKDVLGFTFLLLCAVQIQGHSIITGDSGPNVTQLTTNNLDLKTVDLFRQLLNQETLIRMGLEKDLQELKNDVVAMKTADHKSNLEMADLQKEVEQLKKENQRIQLENIAINQSIETAGEKTNIEMADLQREVEKLKQENQRLQLVNVTVKQNIETLESAMKQDIKTLESASQKTKLEMAGLQQEVLKLKLENTMMKQDLETLESASQKTNLKVEKLKQENQRLLQNSKYNIWRNL